MPELDALTLFAVWGIILLASILRAFTGFGFALAAMPIFAQVLSPAQAVVLSASLSFGIGVVSAHSYINHIPRRVLWPMITAALVGTYLGASILMRLAPEQFLLGIGLAVITACVILSLYQPQPNGGGLFGSATSGLVSGLLNGTFAIPGPPAIVYALMSQPDPARARALLLGFFTLSAMAALSIFAYRGLVGMGALHLFVIGFPVMIIGDNLGLLLFRHYGNELYRHVAIAALLGIGLAATAKALTLF